MIRRLIRINLAALFAGSFRQYRSKKKIKPVKAILIGLLVIYVVGAMLLSFGMMFHAMSGVLFAMGLGWFYFALAGMIMFALCFIGSVFMIQSQIFNARDNELLLSMPIKPRDILAGRLCALLIIEYIFEAMIVIPAFVILVITGYISAIPVVGIIFFFAASVILPLLALTVGCLIGWIITLVTSRLRRKNIVTVVLSFAFLAAYFWLYNALVVNISALVERGHEIAEAVRRAVFPAYHYGVAIAEGSVVSFVLFALCAVVPFIVVYFVLTASYMKLATGSKGAKKIEYREKELRVSGARTALVKRELRVFASMPLYILNSALGAVATLVVAVILIIRPGLLLDPLIPLFELMPQIDFNLIGAAVITALAALNVVSAPSISLEGKSLWIAKSLPVSAWDILFSKAGLHMLVSGVPSVFASIVCIFALRISDVAVVLLTLVLPLSLTLLFAFLGLTLNLAFPRFDWINPVQPVKQGLSSMLTLFSSMALIIVVALLYVFLFASAMSLTVFLLLCTVLFLILSGVLYLYLKGAGCRKFDSL